MTKQKYSAPVAECIKLQLDTDMMIAASRARFLLIERLTAEDGELYDSGNVVDW